MAGWKRRFGTACAALTLGAGAALASELPRRAQLGVAVSQGYQGADIEEVVDGATAANAGLRMSDVIKSINGVVITGPADVVKVARDLKVGDTVTFEAKRGRRTLSVSATATAPRMETYPGADVKFGAVSFQGGQLRDILVTPQNAPANGFVVYFIQGVTCMSVEALGPTHIYAKFMGNLAARGVATYRVEKPGMGDSRGGPDCAAIDFDTEMAAFKAGYRALIDTHGFKPDRIVVFGHSMGGVQGPLLVQDGPQPAGFAVYGTAVRRWMDYFEDVIRLQNFRFGGGDASEGEALLEELRPTIAQIFQTDRPLTDIAKDDPKVEAHLREVLGWDGADSFMGRTAAYWRGVDDQRMAAAWTAVKTPVLVMHGDLDVATVDDQDHKLLAEIVNRLRPGAATYASFPETGHGFTIDTPEKEPTVKAPPFNDAITTRLADWIATLPKPK